MRSASDEIIFGRAHLKCALNHRDKPKSATVKLNCPLFCYFFIASNSYLHCKQKYRFSTGLPFTSFTVVILPIVPHLGHAIFLVSNSPFSGPPIGMIPIFRDATTSFTTHIAAADTNIATKPHFKNLFIFSLF